MSHRGKEFEAVNDEAMTRCKQLLGLGDTHDVLFLQGGAAAMFGVIPMNILRGKTSADYVNTGQWSKKAIGDAKKYCKVNVAASSEAANFTYVPKQSEWKRTRAA